MALQTKITNGDLLKAEAEARGIPKRTLDQTRASLQRDHARDPAIARSMAHMMVQYGNCTDEARQYCADYLKTGAV